MPKGVCRKISMDEGDNEKRPKNSKKVMILKPTSEMPEQAQ